MGAYVFWDVIKEMNKYINPYIKHNFLILGVTGPLSSGCTTVSRFFTDELEKKIEGHTYMSDQSCIEEEYNNIAGSSQLGHPFTSNNPSKLKTLKQLLRTREIKKVLSSELSKGEVPTFNYISMSDMLLKFSVEYVLSNHACITKSDIKFKNIIKIILDEKFDHELIKEINFTINKKKFRNLKIKICEEYDLYLIKILKLKEKIKKEIKDPEKLGDILQDMGDNIRKSGNPFLSNEKIINGAVTSLAEQANRIIKFMRNRPGDSNKRNHFVIECFRNPFEVEYFRYRYYEFYLLSVCLDEEKRQKRENFSKQREERDRGERNDPKEIYKQNVSRCVYLSDIAINNDTSIDDLHSKLLQYYALIREPGCITPTKKESLMDRAYSLSLLSSCISRQVGAVIVDKDRYVVGAGWNDVGEGQIGCGYRQRVDVKNLDEDVLVTNPVAEKSFRRYLSMKGIAVHSFCFKDEYSRYTLTKKFKKFMRKRKIEFEKFGNKEGQQKMIEDWLSHDVEIKRLEYCRALHAEENALLQTSKIGGMGVKGGSIYTTAFPCELCAKKLYQSGIEEIIFTEPYPESISQEVFLKDGIKKVKLTQFEGVKSHSYFRLYKAPMDKKEMQILQELDGD